MLLEIGVPENKIHLTPNGVNPFFLEPSTESESKSLIEKFNLTLDAPILLFIGNHTANKGIDTVMEIASRLSRPATFVIGGKLRSPDEPEQWQARFPKGDGIEVIFTDYLTISEQRVLYRLANILLFPSLADTLPLTIIEAMANQLPVIAYDVGGISYQLQADCGILVKSGDFQGFLAAVEEAISKPELRFQIAKNAKLRQESIFAWEKTARTTINMYNCILNS
jgi:alpha-maltose-1-phosphate synthase